MVPAPVTVIIAHHTRTIQAAALAKTVGATRVFVDCGDHGSLWNHRRALNWAMTVDQRVWVLEDDALPGSDFNQLARDWGHRFPHALISGYLGKQRPPQWQETIGAKLSQAADTGKDNIHLPQLVHGLCYSIPPTEIPRVINGLSQGPADYSIGEAWGKDVLYTIPSLVDHADGTPVELHPDGIPRQPGRVAWNPPNKGPRGVIAGWQTSILETETPNNSATA